MRCVEIYSRYIFVVLCSVIFRCTVSQNADSKISSTPVVTVREGQLKGVVDILYDGSSYYSFKGIRYAQAPFGQLRFKAPLPVKPWQGVYDASKHGPICPQYDIDIDDVNPGSEDCLYLNIYTKSLQPDSKIPVMVYIHGGGFMTGSGSSNDYGPDFLLQHDVILVTINYRLEVLGFLALDTPEVPGNAGMKDQVLALKWVKNNIRQFGGDPDKITIFGESSGGAAATYHMLSPMSKGLFHKVISQSGVAIQDWAVGVDPRARAFRLGKFLGKETKNVTELLEFLQSVPAVNLARVTNRTMTTDEEYRSIGMHFVPVIEKKFDNVESFICENPVDILLANKVHKVPLMLGYNSAEGMITLGDRLRRLDFYNKNLQYIVPRQLAEKLSQEKMTDIGRRIRNFYVGNRNMTENDAQALVYMESDINFVYNIHRFPHFYSKTKQPIYLYRFTCETDLNILKKLLGYSHLKGVCHADDLYYIMLSNSVKDIYGQQPEVREIVYRVSKLWANFAKTSNPTPDNSLGVHWRPFTCSGNEYMNIDKQFSMLPNKERDRLEFWNNLYRERGLPHF